jgi:hypothetical protein
MDELKLKKYNSIGLVPGPLETEADYQKRVDYCLQLKNQLNDTFSDALPYENEQAWLAPALQITGPLYDISPAWVPLFFSNQQLLPWHAGAAWIFQKVEKGPLGALLQLRKALYQKPVYFLVYHRDEIIAHELCHVGRMAFEEKRFEELLAYRTSDRFFPRYFGPILQSVGESRLFIIVLLTLLIMDFSFLFLGSLKIYFQMFYLKLIPVFLILWGVFRLRKRQGILQEAERQLKAVWGEAASFILYRLTDREIEQFSKQTADQIRNYAEQENSLRWQAIKTAYPLL